MRRVLLEKKDIHKGSLVLVNRDHGLPRQIGGEQLQSLGGSVSMEKAAAAQLGRLLERKREIVCVSGFRSREEQEELYCRSLEEYGEVFTRKYVAEPGHSEHEGGLAVDLAQSGAPPDLIRPSFPDSGVCRSFRKKAPWFGFIQRYEEGKEDVTGIACEPWHFRYVGFPHSLLMRKKGLALEEYLDLLKASGELIWKYAGRRFQIRYVDIGGKTSVFAEIPERKGCRISGDNRSGFIVTLF